MGVGPDELAVGEADREHQHDDRHRDGQRQAERAAAGEREHGEHRLGPVRDRRECVTERTGSATSLRIRSCATALLLIGGPTRTRRTRPSGPSAGVASCLARNCPRGCTCTNRPQRVGPAIREARCSDGSTGRATSSPIRAGPQSCPYERSCSSCRGSSGASGASGDGAASVTVRARRGATARPRR